MIIYITFGKWTSIYFIQAYKRRVHYYHCICILDLGKKHIKVCLVILIWIQSAEFFSIMS